MIEARGLGRTFKSRTGVVEAVRGVDFQVGAGELVGFLGPNGAGKTTTLRMLATLLAPTAGQAVVAGCDLRRDPRGVRRRIGYVAQGGATNGAAIVLEELVMQARLYGVPAAEAAERASALAARLGLEDVTARRVRTLSGGQRRRLDVALGMVHGPQLLFLDEPSTGLDPQSRANLWDHIRAVRKERGTTVFLTTHYLDEADALCDRILIMDHGQIVASGTPAELKRRIGGDVVTFEVEDATAAERGRALLADRTGVRDATVTGNDIRVTVDRGDAQALPLMRTLDGAGVSVSALRMAHPSLDDVFLTLTGRSLRDSAAA